MKALSKFKSYHHTVTMPTPSVTLVDSGVDNKYLVIK